MRLRWDKTPPSWGVQFETVGRSNPSVEFARMLEFIRRHFGFGRITFLFHYLLARAQAKSIMKLLPIVEQTFSHPWVTRVELDIRFFLKSPRKKDLITWDDPVTVCIFRKRRGKERQALRMSVYIRSGVLYITQLQGLRGTDVPPELRFWARMFIEACKKFACQQGLQEVRVARASTLYSFWFPHGSRETLSDDLRQSVVRIRRDMELIYDRNAWEAGLVPDGNWFRWKNAKSAQSYQPSILQHANPVAASLGLTTATTAILFQMHDSAATPQRLVFYYLLPLILITIFYSSRAALSFAGVAMLCAAYFLQDPVFSFYTSEWDDLIWFAVSAALAIKTTERLFPPSNHNVVLSL
jgi:Domain of unknown function (DUF4118)